MYRIPAVFPVLETNRMVLRRLSQTDMQNMFLLRSDPEVNRYLSGYSHSDIRQTAGFMDTIERGTGEKKWLFWVMEMKVSASFAGTICLWNFNPGNNSAEVGYTMLPVFYGKGLMTEALEKVMMYGFETLGLASVKAYTHKENHPSARVLQRCGFTFMEGMKNPENKNHIVFMAGNESAKAKE